MENAVQQPTNFFSSVFDTSLESRAMIMNVIQYMILALILMLISSKLLYNYIPIPDPEKSNLSLIFEILIELVSTFIGIIIIHRIILFIPSMSGTPYADVNIISIIIPIAYLLIMVPNSLNEKINIITDRMISPPKKKPSPTPKLEEPNFNSMMAGPATPLVDAAEPPEPIAANSFGGSLFA
jgi:hypothetical protein